MIRLLAVYGYECESERDEIRECEGVRERGDGRREGERERGGRGMEGEEERGCIGVAGDSGWNEGHLCIVMFSMRVSVCEYEYEWEGRKEGGGEGGGTEGWRERRVCECMCSCISSHEGQCNLRIHCATSLYA